MPTFSADGQWIYFIRTSRRGPRQVPDRRLPEPRRGTTSTTPGPHPDEARRHRDAERLLTGRTSEGSSTWFYWLRQPVPSPDGKTVAVVSDGPNPLQSDIVLQLLRDRRRRS